MIFEGVTLEGIKMIMAGNRDLPNNRESMPTLSKVTKMLPKFEVGKSYDEIEMSEKMEEKKRVRMALTWINQRGDTVAIGEAIVIPPPKTR